jgi:hypothetical protein
MRNHVASREEGLIHQILSGRCKGRTFLHKAIRTQGLPENITIEKSGATTAAIAHDNKIHKAGILLRHSQYLNKYCRTGSSRRETAHASYAELQVLLGGTVYHRGHSSHACDSQRPVGDPRHCVPNASRAILCLSRLDYLK